ncbi:MAG TPA: HAD-IIIA family hydrolase [Gemmatimonadales bacterium]|nr:HAD-IIIA family hydrolase [Gemmatimonadales bacterium]
MRAAVFLDRDGVLNDVPSVENGIPMSPRRVSEFRVAAGTRAAVERLRQRGLPVFVASNQPDLARGKMDPDESARMIAVLRQAIPLDDVAVCPHDDADGCDCRKPKPGLLIQVAERWGVDLSRSFMVGDSWKDLEAGRRAGCHTILLRRDYNATAQADTVVGTLDEAVQYILQHNEEGKRMSFSAEFCRHTAEVAGLLPPERLEAMVEGLVKLRARGGRLFFLGVGGGAGHASHAVNDFRKLAGIECYAPTDNVSELTARINDEGWDTSYAEWLKGSRIRAGDGVFVFSVGGGSAARNVSMNIVRALDLARSVGASIFGVVGRDGGRTAELAEACVIVPTVDPELVTPLTEAFQAVVWHLLVSHPKLKANAMKWESLGPTPKQGS